MQSESFILPVIDISALVEPGETRDATATAIHDACRRYGFFYVTGHGVDQDLQSDLERVSRLFFDLDEEDKMSIAMERAGRAWRGFFPVGTEMTAGRPDLKEGLYFGTELSESDPRVAAGIPMHGSNLFPEAVPEMRDIVLSYIEAMTQLGHRLMVGLSLSLGLPSDRFRSFTSDPLVLFRIFHYPPNQKSGGTDEAEVWGVGEHTDYGLLTILKQDDTGGLEVRAGGSWIDAPPVEGAFVCNLGDMLDRLTGGYYRSTPHRVKNRSDTGRLSFPFFFDPNFDAVINRFDLGSSRIEPDDRQSRWDRQSVHDFEGTYGSYLLAKVAKVFPGLLRM